MRLLIRIVLFSVLSTALLAKEATPSPAASAELRLREVRYTGTLSDSDARFVVEIDAESGAAGEASVPLFAGDVAVRPPKLPPNLRLVRDGNVHRLVAARPGRYKFSLEVVARITRAERWNEVAFTGPTAGIASLTAAAGAGTEVQLLAGTPDVETAPGAGAPDASHVRGLLGATGAVALRWQSKATEAARQALVTCETTAAVAITPTVIKFTTQLRYDIVQGNLPVLVVTLPPEHALTRVEGSQIRDWHLDPAGAGELQTLTVELVRPAEKNYLLTLFSEQPVATTPAVAHLGLPQPQSITRESGSLTLAGEDALVELETATGLRQVNPATNTLAAYRFTARPVALELQVRRIEPVVRVATRITTRVEEARVLATHALALTVEKAGLYALELAAPADWTVTDVRGEGVEEWKVQDGRLLVNFSSRVLGARPLEVQLEQARQTFPDQLTVTPLRLAGAMQQTAQLAATAAPGIRLKTAELAGLREIPAAQPQPHGGEVLAYVADQADWTLRLGAERLAPRVVAEVFNLVTIGDGLVGGSATLRYGIINQGVQEFKVRLPANWKNVEFTGPNIRRKDQAGDVWTIGLQDKAWGGYTLVVTYDEQFDPHQATLTLGGAHALEVERETGSLAVTSAASLQLREARATGPLRRVDENELAETDRALITRAVLLAYEYTGDTYDLAVNVNRFQELPVLQAVADRTQLTTVLTEAGQMLTQASFMVKNNDKQFQRFTLPGGAEFWSAYADGQPVKAERQGDALLVPLPRGANRDQAFAVEIVYAQTIAPLKSFWPRALALTAPRTDVQTTFAEWELYVPAEYALDQFAGNMAVPRGTTYQFRDAWDECASFYGSLRAGAGSVLWLLVALAVVVAFALAARRRGWSGAFAVLAGLFVLTLLGSMFLPALAKSKSRALQVQATRQLTELGVALREHAQQHQEQFPASIDEVRQNLRSKLALQGVEGGDRLAYVGEGKRAGDPNAVVAFSTADADRRSVLFADGRVEQLGRDKFAEIAPPAETWGFLADGVEDSKKDGNELVAIEGLGLQPAAAPATPALSVVPAPIPAATRLVESEAFMKRYGRIGRGVVNGAVNSAVGLGGVGGGAGVALPADRPAAAAAVAGIRPIRIEIPRTGHRTVFTKVLNVRDEPLALTARSGLTRTRALVRGGGQLALFLAGLALAAWQLRRPRPVAFLVALAAAAMLASLADFLIAARLLGSGLIVLVPLLVLVLLFVLARRWWKRGGEASAATDPAPVTPPPLVTAALAFLLCLGASQTAGAAAVTNVTALPLAPASGVSLLAARYTGVVRERVAEVEAVIQLTAATPGQLVPLFTEEVAVKEFSATPADAKLVRTGNTLSVQLGRKGPASLRIKFLVKLGGDVTRREIAFGIPPALSSELQLTVDEPEAAVEFPAAVAFHSTTDRQQTRIEAIMAAGERVELRWTPRVKRAAEIAATVFATGTTLARFEDGALNLRTTLDYQVTQGELREARLRLPAGLRLLRVEGVLIRTWQVKPGAPAAEEQTLTVELLKGVSPGYRLVVETEQALAAVPNTTTIATPHALDVKREAGWLAVSASEELGLTIEQADGLQKADAAEFVRAAGGTAPLASAAIASAFQFLQPDFALRVRVATLQPQIEALVRNRLKLGTEQIRLDAQLEFTIKRAGVFAVRVALPEDFRVETVTGEFAQWTEKGEGAGRFLEVTLKQRTVGAYALQLQLVRSLSELPKAFAAVGVHPLDADKVSGFVTVANEVGVQIKTSAFTGLTEVPAAASGEAGASLAYKFLAGETRSARAPWTLTVATEAVEPWVRAEVVNWVTLSDTLISGRAVVRYDVANAPVKQFRLRVPAAFRNVEVTGANIRRRDQQNGEWRVELQNKVVGAYTLTVTWDQPGGVTTNASALALAGVQALDVERETGAVAVNARPPLQVEPRQASSELIQIDARELPEWAGRADAATVLAYRYLRPGYQLTVSGQRFEAAQVLQALADTAHLTTVVAEDGQMMTELTLAVRNHGRQYLALTLPPGAQVWSAFVAGRAVRPSERDGQVLLPLERAGAEDAPVAVELTYVSAERFPRTQGDVALASPALDVPVKNARWELYLPPDFSYRGFAGTMTRVADGAPVYRAFSLGDYSLVESSKSASRKREAVDNLDRARSELSRGDAKSANFAYSQLRAYKESDTDSGRVQQLEEALNRSQGGNLLKAQQGVLANNTLLFGERAGSAAPVTALDALAAEQQWGKLKRAQEITAVAVQPLRVNLPTHGLRHSFEQILQTDVGQPMRLTFSAANTQTRHWPTQLGWGLAAFAGLWALTAAALRPARSSQQIR